MVTPRRLRPRAAAVALVVVTAACNPFAGDEEEPTTTIPPPPTQPPSQVGVSIDGTLRVGAVLPLTGDLAQFGPGMRAAVELAVDEMNDAGGVLGKDVELLIEDSASTAEQAEQAARRLVDESKVDALVGPASTVELTPGVLEHAFEARRVVCSPTASAPRLSGLDEHDLFFSMTPNRAGEAEVIAGRLRDRGDARVAVVLRDDPDAAGLFEGLVGELEEQFGAGAYEIVAEVTVPPAEGAPAATAESAPASPGEAVDAVGAARPQAVVLLLQPDEAAPLLRMMSDVALLPSQGDTGLPVFVSDALASEDLAPAVDPEKPGVLRLVRGVRPRVDPAAATPFDARLRARTGLDEVDLAAHAYDCTSLIALGAAAAASDDPAAIAGEIVELTRGGAACGDVPACAGPVTGGEDRRYLGALGVELNDVGEPRFGTFEVFEFDDQGRIAVVEAFEVEQTGAGGAGERPAPVTTTTAPRTASTVDTRTTSPKATTTVTGARGGFTTTTAPGGTTTTTTPGATTTSPSTTTTRGG